MNVSPGENGVFVALQDVIDLLTYIRVERELGYDDDGALLDKKIQNLNRAIQECQKKHTVFSAKTVELQEKCMQLSKEFSMALKNDMTNTEKSIGTVKRRGKIIESYVKLGAINDRRPG